MLMLSYPSLYLALAFTIPHGTAVTIYGTPSVDPLGNPLLPTGVEAIPPPARTLDAYNLTELTPPPLPSPMPAKQYTAQLYPGGMARLSIPVKGNFVGFSVELSVANQILGTNSSRLAVPFLNYVAGLKSRSGAAPPIRVGGNTQEKARLFLQSFENRQFINKTENINPLNPTRTPDVDISLDLYYAMTNVSAFLGVEWYIGLPFADATNVTGISAMLGHAEKILGDRLVAAQLANEPDLYGIGSRKRPNPYPIGSFMDEWGRAIEAINNDPLVSNKQSLLGPSICCNIDGQWSIDQVIQAGFVTGFDSNLKILTVQRYPHDNCDPINPTNPQTLYADYLSHTNLVNVVKEYNSASAYALQHGKPLVMFETNTASCGGFVGLSDSFGAGLWGIDYSLQMAWANFSNVLYHFGGQTVAYNAFTPPPGTINIEDNFGWTTGPMYYMMLMVAEALGPSNNSRVVDLKLNYNNPYTPGYAIYEGPNPTKLVLINYMNDPSGAADTIVTVSVGGGTTNVPAQNPQTAYVRYYSANSVTQKYNLTYAGQTMGAPFQSDGRLRGKRDTQQITCDANTGCRIPLKGPSAALVFLTQDSLNAVNTGVDDDTGDPSNTFPTTTETGRYAYGAKVDQGVLQTSNGRGGKEERKKQGLRTSHGDLENGTANKRVVGVSGLVIGMMVVTAVGLFTSSGTRI